MKDIVLQTLPVMKKSSLEAEKRKKSLALWNFTLILSMSSGIFLSLAGLILGTISYLNIFKNSVRVNFIGNLMIIASFPLLMLGAHALDKISNLKKEIKNSLFLKSDEF